MKRYLIGFAAAAVGLWLMAPAKATTCGAPPFTLVNGQTADANQVMSNFTALVTCANNVLTSATIAGANLINSNISGTTSLPGAGQISAGGFIGIGMTPVNALDITANSTSGVARVKVLNPNSGGSAILQTASDAAGMQLGSLGSAFGGTPFGGVTGNSQVIMEADAASSFYIGTSPAAPIIFAQNRAEVARIDTTGLVGIGMTPARILDITQTVNSNAIVGLHNLSGGNAATLNFDLFGDMSAATVTLYNSGFSTSGFSIANGMLIQNTGAGGIVINAASGGVTIAASGVPALAMSSTAVVAQGLLGVTTFAAATNTHVCHDGSNNLSACQGTSWSTPGGFGTGTFTFNHGLGLDYKAKVQVVIVCTSTDAGYAVGDSVILATTGPANGSNNVLTIAQAADGNSTFVTVGIGVAIAAKGTGTLTNLTLNKWNITVGVTPNT